MLRPLVVVLLGTCTFAFELSSVATRRAALSAAAPAIFASPLAALAVGENKVGYACRGSEDCGVDAQAKRVRQPAFKLSNSPPWYRKA